MNYAQKIIQKFGGVRALARLMERPTSTVGSWGERGSIPDEDKARIMALGVQHDICLTADDFFPRELLPAPVVAQQNGDAASPAPETQEDAA